MGVVLTWNVAGRVTGIGAQIDVVSARDDDVVCLQEVTPKTAPLWTAALERAGFGVAVSPWPPITPGSRRLVTLIASRAPVEALSPIAELPWPERHLAVRTELDGAPVEIHTLHAPLSSKPDQAKVRTLEALHEALTQPSDVARVVAGDFNTPSYESRDGEIQTFARTRAGNIRPAYGERHDRAELLLIDDLPKRGWRDAFRAVHGYQARDRSYMFPNGKFGWRLDHIVASPELEPVACEYLHEWREAKLSDHSAMWAELATTQAVSRST